MHGTNLARAERNKTHLTLDQSSEFCLHPVEFNDVTLNAGFWRGRLNIVHETTLPYALKRLDETHSIANFALAAGMSTPQFTLDPYRDSDVYKVIEGAAYALADQFDKNLHARIVGIIDIIAKAQESDGYLYTARTAKANDPRAGSDRWLNERGAETPDRDSHELCNAGHLYEAAAAWYLSTGDRRLLDIAIKNANLIDKVWGPGKLEIPPGHQGIEIGLVKLYRVTGERRYLNLAKFLLDCRGRGNYIRSDGFLDEHSYADDLPVVAQTEVQGQSVRSMYMYAGMADIAALCNDRAYLTAVERLWGSYAGSRMYLTGGIGSDGGAQGFGKPFNLPNDAHAETCAAIAEIFWNYRMFLMSSDARYFDIVERAMFNGAISGLSLTGDRFFYTNPLTSAGKDERAPWHDTACCPTNLVRFLPSVGGYLYATSHDRVYVNSYASGTAVIEFGEGSIELTQATDYPWTGVVELTVRNPATPYFKIALRIPGWAVGRPVPSTLYHYTAPSDERVEIKVNGVDVSVDYDKGYAVITRPWEDGDAISLNIPMPVKSVYSDPRVKGNNGHYALERGPIVYCVESVDNGGKAEFILSSDPASWVPDRLNDHRGGVVVLRHQASSVGERLSGVSEVIAIPYSCWANRGLSRMNVWLKEADPDARPS